MSTTSTTFNDCKRNIKNCTSTTNEKHAKSFRTRQETTKNIPLKKRSNERVLNELSSFIAEFSYLTDGQDSRLEIPKKPIQPYNTHPEQSSENDEGFFNPRSYRKNYIRRGKSVEWIDQARLHPEYTTNEKFETPIETRKVRRCYISRQTGDLDYVRPYPDHKTNEQFYIESPVETNKVRRRSYISRQGRDLDYARPYPDHTTNERFYIETPVETSNVRRRRYISRQARDLDYVIERLKERSGRSPNKRIKIKTSNEGNSHNRSPRSTLKYCKSCHNGKKLMRFRIESNERNGKLPHQSARRKRSKSVVRDWPLRYKKKKTYRIRKHTIVRKENCIPFERKEEISSASPTVITLYPKNARDKHSQDKINELEFLVDPNIPCKCLKCMRKYELLQQIANDEQNTLYFKPKNEFQTVSISDDDIVSHAKTLSKHPEKCACKKTRRSGHTVLNPQTSNQVETNVIRPRELKCTAACENNCCCNKKIQRCHIKCSNDFCECSKNLVHYPIPPNNQPCYFPKQMMAGCCRPCQLYEPYPSLYHKPEPCPYPCDDKQFMSNWNLNEIGSCDEQNGDTSYKSIYFRFDCVGHQIDPTVTQYFQSILNNKIY